MGEADGAARAVRWRLIVDPDRRSRMVPAIKIDLLLGWSVLIFFLWKNGVGISV